MEKILKKIMPYSALYIGAVALGVFLLFIVSKIPQEWLTENWKEGRNHDIAGNLFTLVVEYDYSTFVDDFTDSMKMNLAYRLNENSVLLPTAYSEAGDYHYEYGRYWQGYCIVLRPLMLFFNMSQIRILYGALSTIAFVVLLVQLVKKKKYEMAIAMVCAVYVSNHWVTTLALQYFNCTFISLLASLILVCKPKIYEKQKCLFFMGVGIIVNYFDFLTFESLTLSLPLLCAELMNEQNSRYFERLKKVIKASLAWAIGYVAMFAGKWCLYILVKGQEALDLIGFKLIQRSSGTNTAEVYSVKESLMLNLSGLKGIDTDNWISISIFIIIVLVIYVFLVRGIPSYNLQLILLVIGFIPVARFILITEHSATHSYFTYHALFSTTSILLYIVISNIAKVIKRDGRRKNYGKKHN